MRQWRSSRTPLPRNDRATRGAPKRHTHGGVRSRVTVSNLRRGGLCRRGAAGLQPAGYARGRAAPGEVARLARGEQPTNYTAPGKGRLGGRRTGVLERWAGRCGWARPSGQPLQHGRQPRGREPAAPDGCRVVRVRRLDPAGRLLMNEHSDVRHWNAMAPPCWPIPGAAAGGAHGPAAVLTRPCGRHLRLGDVGAGYGRILRRTDGRTRRARAGTSWSASCRAQRGVPRAVGAHHVPREDARPKAVPPPPWPPSAT